MPVRKIPPSGRSITGQLASPKAVGRAESESTLEHDLLTLLAFDSAVERFEVQPVRIDYTDESGKRRRYTPDVLVHFRAADSGLRPPLLVEVKPREVLRRDWADIRRKVRAARAFAAGHGWQFRLLTEKHIRTPRLKNARFLLPFTRRAPDPAMEALLLERLRELRSATADVLLAAVYWSDTNREMLLPSLWRLVAAGAIECDLQLPLTMATLLRPAEG